MLYLAKRVNDLNVDDWLKLKKLSFLKQTKHRCDNLDDAFTWIDAIYAVYPNICSHAGEVISLSWRGGS